MRISQSAKASVNLVGRDKLHHLQTRIGQSNGSPAGGANVQHGNATPRLNAIRFAAWAGFAHWLIHNVSFLSFVIDLIFCSRQRFTCPCRKTGFVVAQNDGFVDEPCVLVRLPGLHHLSVAHCLMTLRPPSGPAAASQKFGPQRERLLSASLARGLAIAPMAVRHPFVVLPSPSPMGAVMSY